MWTSSVCFVCLKSFNYNKGTPDENVRLNFTSKNSSNCLALFFERFLKLPPESPLISSLCSKRQQSSSRASSSFLDEFCSECLQILDETLQLYNELCEVGLKMAWRLGQWEALLKVNETSKPSSKLRSLMYQKLSKQLELNNEGMRGTEEVRKMRSLLLSHCTKARNGMLDHRKLEVALDRCTIPFPVTSSDFGTTTTSFLVLDSDPSLSNEVDVVVKRELDDQFEPSDVEDSAAMDFEADDDFSNTNNLKQEQEPNAASSSTESVAASRLRVRRSTKSNNFSYFPKIKKDKAKKVKVEKPKLKKETVPVSRDGVSCQLCGRVMATLKILRRHLYAHVNKRFNMRKRPAPTFQCRFCWMSFIFEQQRWIHEQIGTHDKNMTAVKFTCYEEACNSNPPFPTFNDLEAHFESVHQTENESVHKCSLCQWPFTSDDMRQVHELNHIHFTYTDYNSFVSKTGKPPPKEIKCPTCERQNFSTFSALRTHFISEHTNLEDERIHKCHKCSNSYIKAVSLLDHLKTHEMEEDLASTKETGPGSSNASTYHICEKCGKRCANRRLLERHKNQVHREKQCTLCGEIVKGQFSKHMKTVHNEPQHSCPICQKIFCMNFQVKRHMQQMHPGGKEREGEVCHICAKKYQRRGLLHRHLRVAHQIEAPELKRPAEFICPDCGMGYYHKVSLEAHVDAKHRRPEERKYHFPCTLCSKTFCRKCLLTKHLEDAHPPQ